MTWYTSVMNIFVVNQDPIVAAKNLCDKHVVKMIVETAQLLSTTHRVLDGNPAVVLSPKGRKIKRYLMENIELENTLCKSVMVNHPCTQWTMQSTHNYNWLLLHGKSLCSEYTYRYYSTHSMQHLFDTHLSQLPINLIKNGKHESTPYAQAMPEQYRNPDNAVEAYRNYYIHEKNRFAKWTRREPPMWYTQGLLELNNSKGLVYG